MVYARYIKKRGKTFGPYYYENVNINGKIKSVYLGTDKPSESKQTDEKIKEFQKNIELCDKRKEEIKEAVTKLQERQRRELISFSQYEYLLNNFMAGRSAEEWINYYERCKEKTIAKVLKYQSESKNQEIPKPKRVIPKKRIFDNIYDQRIHTLNKKIELCDEKKREIQNQVKTVVEKHKKGVINYSEYEYFLNNFSARKPVNYWLNYYDAQKEEALGQIDRYKLKATETPKPKQEFVSIYTRRIFELKKNIGRFTVAKAERRQLVQKLDEKRKQGIISYTQYEYALNKSLNGRTLEEWDKYYDNNITKTVSQIEKYKIASAARAYLSQVFVEQPELKQRLKQELTDLVKAEKEEEKPSYFKKQISLSQIVAVSILLLILVPSLLLLSPMLSSSVLKEQPIETTLSELSIVKQTVDKAMLSGKQNIEQKIEQFYEKEAVKKNFPEEKQEQEPSIISKIVEPVSQFFGIISLTGFTTAEEENVTILPEEHITLPEQNVTIPVENITLPEENFTLPEENITLPEPFENLTEMLTNIKEGLRDKPYKTSVKLKELTKEDVKFRLEAESEDKKAGITIRGLENISNIEDLQISTLTDNRINKGRITTSVASAKVAQMENATITLQKEGNVNAIVKCDNWDFVTATCEQWTETEIPFVDDGENITFTVTEFSGYAGAEITIINVQSYPMVGGNWTVMFNTTGTADLTITSVNATTWNNVNEDNQLKFLEIRCGENVLDYEWINDGPENSSVFIADYSCNDTGYEISKVLIAGKHTLQFRFGDDIEYAFNNPGPGWWNGGWLYRKEINITNASSSDLTDFPAFINVTYDSDMLGDYLDLRFINGSCGSDSTELAYEIEKYTANNALVWVKIPILSTDTTSICMYYGNSQASSGENTTGVWNSSYLGVWHLSETSGNAKDSTSNANNGTVTGATMGAVGIVDSAYSFDGTDDYIDITINIPATVTISAWATYTGPGTDMLWCINNAGTGGPDLFFGVPGSGVIALNTWDSWSNPLCNVPSSSFMQEWHLYTTIIDSAGTELYIDDTFCGNASYKNPTKTSFAISSSNGYDWVGGIDEVRISNEARSSAWINQSYYMVANQSVYVSFGNEEMSENPIVSLVSPQNNYVTSDTTITFNCSAIDTAMLENITLYTDISGSWEPEITKDIGGTSNSSTWTNTSIAEGNYIWNCLVYDSDSNSGWGNENYTFTIDKTPPTLTINSPTGTLADVTPTINVSFGESVDTAWYNIDNGENITLCTSCSSIDTTYLHLAEGSYTIYVFANSTLGNINDTESSSFTIDMNENYYDTFDDSSSIAVYNNVTWNKGNVSSKSTIAEDTGNGYDGALTVTSANTIVNNYTYLAGDESTGNLSITVNDGSAFSNGDEILIIQIQNGNGLGQAGNYEFREIVSGGGTTTLTLDSGLENTYGSGTFNTTNASTTQIVRVPQYTTLTVNSGASITASAWDGYTGGIVVFKATGTVTVNGTIDVSEKGYRGGLHGTPSNCANGEGEQGESYLGTGACGYYAGNLDGDDPNGGGGGVDVTGGGGGYGTAGTNSDSWDGGAAPVGQGGLQYGVANLTQILLGSGGGGCYQGGSDSGDGGDGGGSIIIFANSVSVSGGVKSTGQEGLGYGQGTYLYGTGGGSGGSIYILADDINIGDNFVNATGGIGYQTTRKGGDGGVGRIRLDYNSLTGTTYPPYYAGSTTKIYLDGSFTSTTMNTTQDITQITNVTWTEENTDANNNITVELSVDAGQNWYDAINGQGITGFTQDNYLVYRVNFTTNGSKSISLLDVNISWIESYGPSTPTILDISNIPDVDLSEGTSTPVEFSFLADDQDGISDLVNESTQANFSQTGQDTRWNITNCVAVVEGSNATTLNYTCTIDMQYWDGAGTWTVDVQAGDGNVNVSLQEPFTVNTLSAMNMTPNTLTWGSLFIGDTNQLSNNDPVIVTNTGNQDVTAINVEAISLIGEITNTVWIPAANFTFNTADACEGTAMVNDTATPVASSSITHGPASTDDLYACLEHVGEDIAEQTYSTTGAIEDWTVSVST